ncbi:hypothetical protein RSOLAG1IB_06232 [Rhizoctonia solani AG-1 IB]|uniref:Uncharacterized protein n=1 Tax=Thanatephorus cucumeris (strain AG1-IB / isolate 7/3/14) TaxID=1108050 RepID=A0A0B7F6U6_THACB|nr:hypothetical protein RSOLAG1IB_06232 [Rhizoctonia solani AG-1 IB]
MLTFRNLLACVIAEIAFCTVLSRVIYVGVVCNVCSHLSLPFVASLLSRLDRSRNWQSYAQSSILRLFDTALSVPINF